MREVDPRKTFSRRFLLKAAAAAAPTAAVVSATGMGVTDAWAEGGALQPDTMKTMVKVARDIYPHDFLGDVYYITAVKPWNDKAAADPATKAMLEEGVARLNQDSQDRHQTNYADLGWEDDRVALLHGIEQTEFFKKLRSDLVVSLYNQHELWPKFGYEGSSAEYGGYLNRGFNDIDWLPKV